MSETIKKQLLLKQTGSNKPSNEITTTIEMSKENIIICVLIAIVLILTITLICVICKKKKRGEK